MSQLRKINHVVQLMLENRTFDQMLGFLYTDAGNRSLSGDAYDGLTGEEWNPDAAERKTKVFKITPDAAHCYLMPGADPGEGFHNTNYQLFRSDDPAPNQPPTNDGFIVNFQAAINYDLSHHYGDTLPNTAATQVMGMYAPETLPIMSALARGYAVCDRWFASAPTQTIPNRAFAAAGTSQGHLDNKVKVFTCPSIFGRLTDAQQDWAIFGYNAPPLTRHDFPDTLHAEESHFGHFRDFQERAAKGTLPPYTFLEPSWSSSGNSQHPNYDVALGEQLIHDTYRALRDGPGWNETLLLITYDEHGGNFDHVAPPYGAVAPDDSVGEFNFKFDRFGVRIPALLISPLIQKGSVFRPAQGVVDHTSVLKTLSERFQTKPLTKRDAAAPSLGDVLTLAAPRDDDVLKGLEPPRSSGQHPNHARPSTLELLHAEKVAALPVRNPQGSYAHEPPPFTTSGQVGEYIQNRTAAWVEHRARQHKRRAAVAQQAPRRPAQPATTKTAPRAAGKTAPRSASKTAKRAAGKARRTRK
ncbi:MAG: phosphoesterase [Alphaproteobacteria bacterium]|nr:phosphoesterase [Alphaproteobacteria bacterium]MBV8411493.1 phosphoesterase [Alphaproteobacteria bacterium]